MKEYLPEIINVGVYDTRTYFHGVKTTKNRDIREYELEWFTEDGGYAYMNGSAYPIRKNDMLFARPGSERHSKLHFKCRFLHFTLDETLVALAKDIPPFFYCPDRQRVKTLWDETEKGFLSPNTTDQLSSRASLVRLICFLHDSRQDTPKDMLAKAERLIDELFADDPTVKLLAESLNISTSYLHRIFRNAYGYGPHEAVIRRKIAEAKHLLSSEDLPLKDVATKCGFESAAYFSSCFHQLVGISPRAYRNQTFFKP